VSENSEAKSNIVKLVTSGSEILSDGSQPGGTNSESASEKATREIRRQIDMDCAFHPRTDLGNSKRFISRYGDSFLYVDELGWLAWDGKRWNRHEAGAIMNRAIHDTVESIVREAAALKESSHDYLVDKKNDIWQSGLLFDWAVKSQSNAHVSCLAKLVQPHLTASPDSFDMDPMAMNVENGTLRFAKHDTEDYVSFHPHRREDRMTKITPVAWDPAALCPRYDAFLKRVQPDDKMQRHLHALGGVSLTAMPLARLSFWYGTGRNGKSTLADTWAHVMGDYAQTIPIESFLDGGRHRRGGEASPDIAALPGVRFLRTSEPEKGSKLAESLVKLVTGGEPLRARHLNRDFFEFRPGFKMMMQGNYKPRVDGTDEGIWARILLVPWTVMIPEGERDVDLPAKLKLEASGILNRLLDGLRDYMDFGLSPPDEVIQATSEYRDESDPIGRFLKQCARRVPGTPSARVAGKELFRVYVAWAKASGERGFSPKDFSRGLQDHGITRMKSSGIFYCGIELTTAASEFEGLEFEESDDKKT